jgi:hypothetical protein
MYKIKDSSGEELFRGTLGRCRQMVISHHDELQQPGKYFPKSYKLRWDVYDPNGKKIDVLKRELSNP